MLYVYNDLHICMCRGCIGGCCLISQIAKADQVVRGDTALGPLGLAFFAAISSGDPPWSAETSFRTC